MIRILTSVEITKDNPASDYLRFKYNDNSYQEYRITTGKPKTCTTYGGELDKGERKICKGDRVYYLIENDEQISVRCNFTEDCNNFICCIFLIDAYFHGKNFSDAMFDRAIFNEGVNFSHVTFNDKVEEPVVAIVVVVVSKSTLPLNIVSTELTSPLNSAPLKATFSKTTTTPPSFSKKVDFTRAIFNHVLNFSGVENINLDLEHAIIDRIEYGNTKFSADKRETFLTLKNVALKQHDQIKALEFHTQEYQSHYEKLNWNNADKWILGFENSVSYFATAHKHGRQTHFSRFAL
jgi:uncharacterized protein YjbI with pentapeptide repeats